MANIGKQVLVFFLLSILCVYISQYITHILSSLVKVDDMAKHAIHLVTGHMGDWGGNIKNLLGLIVLPLAAGILVAGGFWLVKHVSMPHTMMVIWVAWLVMVVTIYRPPQDIAAHATAVTHMVQKK
jgi:hypothetical protein